MISFSANFATSAVDVLFFDQNYQVMSRQEVKKLNRGGRRERGVKLMISFSANFATSAVDVLFFDQNYLLISRDCHRVRVALVRV